MGKFKLKSPYKLDPVPRYEVPFQPDNINDETGLVAKANKNGTMIINKNIPKNDPIRKEAESHEDHHIKDIMDGKLDYDEDKVYETISTGKVKEHSREDFNESDKNLAWEKDAYKAGENLEQKDMRPKPNKLSGPPNMYEQDTPLAFQKIGSRHKVGRTSDENRISHTERFGPSMEKPNRAGRSKKSGVLSGEFNNFYATGPSLWKGPSAITDKPSGVSANTDISGNLEKEPKVAVKNKDYKGDNLAYSTERNQFYYSSPQDLRPDQYLDREKGLSDIYGKNKTANNFMGLQEDDMGKTTLENANSNRRGEYNKGINKAMSDIMAERKEHDANYNYYADQMSQGNKVEFKMPGSKTGEHLEYVLQPGQDFSDMKNLKFSYGTYNDSGESVAGGGSMTLDEMMKGKNTRSLATAIYTKGSTEKKRHAINNNQALKAAQEKYPNIFSGKGVESWRKDNPMDKLLD